VIDEAAALARDRFDDDRAALVERFVQLFYAGVSPRDLSGRRPTDLYGAAVAVCNLAAERTPGTPLVRVYTPEFEQHGWQSTHSVVEIVTDDLPFLVDSVTMELSRQGVGIHLVVYPMLDAARDDDGQLVGVDLAGDGDDDAVTEALFHVEIDRQADPEVHRRIEDRLTEVLADVRAAVQDWPAMREQLRAVLAELEETPSPVAQDELDEARRFLAWLDDDHFTFLGYRSYDLITEDDGDVLVADPDTGLGILRDAPRSRKPFSEQPPEVRELARRPTLLTLTKANSKATVHRPSYLDYVGVKRFDADGQAVGEWRFLGLYTSRVYQARAQDIPLVRHRVDAVLERADFPPDSHDAKNLLEILETYPRDELFEIEVEELYSIAMGILGLQERKQVRAFVRRDRFGRYYSCLTFVPRDRYNTETRLRMQQVLTETFDARGLEHSVRLSASVLARLHFIVQAGAAKHGEPDVEELERRLAAATRSWVDDLTDALLEEVGEERASSLLRTYAEAFPAGYREDHPPRIGVKDLLRLEQLRRDEQRMGTTLYRPVEAPRELLRFKLYRTGDPVALSEALPLLEDLGCDVVDQRPYEVTPTDGEPVWIHDFGLRCPPGALDEPEERETFQAAFAHVWSGDAEDDGFNRLVLSPGLPWQDVSVLRAYARYLRQTTTRYSPAYLQDALAENPEVAALLVRLFHVRFDPDTRDADAEADLAERIDEALDDVASLDQDRILRSLAQLIGATDRTNHFRSGASDDQPSALALKLAPGRIDDLPRPRPAHEIFVCSPRVEGVHLRGGEVARGGLRWSDRREDFRTEVLGLMKAQTVKNAVIVPVGAKGGFVVKAPVGAGADHSPDRDDVQACYRTFIRSLLDVTDDLVDGEVVGPDRVVRHDGDDPYLVVAADKGTATFSDVANEIARDRDFWLGDAFASGGSTGYDHKAMGITARGAWESVKQHFGELDLDVQTDPITVVGVGDMSGDVFGNGMLLSDQLKLIGAFDHRHVFLDPDPEPEASWACRKELFETPRSTWDDYPRDAISEGGGVWSRRAKSVPLSEQVRELLDVDADRLPPDELIRALLRAPVDLLFNGGVGTFVKASHETHAQVGDKSTDRIRVDADELRCRVVGEGGNLGLTQAARVEYAVLGGRVNTDAIDNSAGVDCSDHEVNIKVLLDDAVASEDLTRKQRNELLAEMTDEVAELVLANNVAQARAISNGVANAASMIDVHRRQLAAMERRGDVDRELESLPSDDALIERRANDRGLVRPELAVLLAITKTTFAEQVLDSDLPEDPWLQATLEGYFPAPLRDRFGDRITEHRLRREIVATQVANRLVNDAGISFLFRLEEETGAEPVDIARAHAVSREVFDLAGLTDQIDDPARKLPAAARIRMRLEVRKLVERGTRWLLRNRRRPLDVAATIDDFAEGTARVADLLPGPLCGSDRDNARSACQDLVDQGVDDDLARRIACLPMAFCALDLVSVAQDGDERVEDVATTYFELAHRLHLDWLRDQVAALPRETRWQALARDALREDVHAQHRELTATVLSASAGEGDVERRVGRWLERHGAQVRRCEQMLAEIEAGGSGDLTVLSVGLRELRNLVTATR
jgi:glutamate dehydrogenase